MYVNVGQKYQGRLCSYSDVLIRELDDIHVPLNFFTKCSSPTKINSIHIIQFFFKDSSNFILLTLLFTEIHIVWYYLKIQMENSVM